MYPYPDSILDSKGLASKRVSRACDRCRLKKTKCNGRRCCNRCLADDAICVFSKRKRSSDRPYRSEYVQLLEDQQMKLVEGVQELYRRLSNGERWTGPTIPEDGQGYPLVQDVLESLAVLATSERRVRKRRLDDTSSEDPDEDNEHLIDWDASENLTITSSQLTPFGSSRQSTIVIPPVEDITADDFHFGCLPVGYPPLLSKPLPENENLYSSFPLLHGQQTLTDGPQYWSITTQFAGGGRTHSFTGLMEPWAETSTTEGWYPTSFMVI